jgi:hypothetical protein
MKSKSPYLDNENRLADVIAAIQVMGAYKFYKLDYSSWADRITGDKSNATYWRRIFEDHPEFFRLDSQKERASLVWRRQYPKRYNVDTNAEISRDEFNNLADDKKLRISRNRLEPETIQALVKTAIDLHSTALGHQQDKRWRIPLIVSGIGGLIGAIIGGLLKSES